MGVYVNVPISECYERTGRVPVKVRWVDHNNDNTNNPNYRNMLVARQFNTGRDDELFAATLPIEALRLIISLTTTGSRTRRIMVNDVSRAYMYADCEE